MDLSSVLQKDLSSESHHMDALITMGGREGWREGGGGREGGREIGRGGGRPGGGTGGRIEGGNTRVYVCACIRAHVVLCGV